ncbi:MAG: OsmC family protein [Pseudomonadota bacterium]
MSTYEATVRWERCGGDFLADDYSRGHVWSFDGGVDVPASASPEIVPLPKSVAQAVDPEEAFVASLASCHMLFFLSLAARRGIEITAYADTAVGYLSVGADGRSFISKVILRPTASYAAGVSPDRSTLESLHHRAHELCFIANSVRSDVQTEIVS